MKRNVQIKRIYDSAESSDGLRILVDRLWPRGVKKEQAALDDWQKDLAPSPELRKWFSHQPERFMEFRERYREEMDYSPAIQDFLRTIADRPKVTLLYAARDPEYNHAAVLREYLREKLANL